MPYNYSQEGIKQSENEETSQLAGATQMGCCEPHLQASSKQPEIELIAALPKAMSTPMNCVFQKTTTLTRQELQ